MTPVSILVVEDEAIVTMDLETRLTRLGYRVVGAVARGEEALARAAEVRPDLVLMDIRLQGEMDGIDAGHLLRTKLDIPVVYLTAYSDDDTLERAKRTEPNGYVVKPFEERSLRAAIEVALYKHEMEKKLKRVERWLAATLGSIGDGVVAADLDGTVTFMNAVAERLTGWGREEALGRPLDDMLRLLEESTGRPIESPVRQVLAAGVVVGLASNGLLVARDGRRVPIEDSAAPIRDEAGRITGVVVVVRDASERRRAAADQAQMSDRLRQAQKLEAIGRLAGGVAHDFNNLMTIVLGHSELLLTRLEPTHPMRSSLTVIQRAAQNAAVLTRQLLAFGRKQALTPTVVDLNEVVTGARAMLDRLIGEDIVLRTATSEREAWVLVDRVQMEQVLLNLAANARDAMPGGGTLTIATSEAYVGEHPDATPGPRVVLTVVDTGVGMDAETLANVFEPFFTTKALGRGTGLGLSAVHGIVTQSGGHVEVESEPGRGTRFSIYLPQCEAPPLAAATPPIPALARGHETILVVEDAPEVRQLVRDVLESCGYTVLEASEPAEGLRHLAEHGQLIRMVISDVVMPEMSGLEMVERMRARGGPVKVLFMSGYAPPDALRASLRQQGAAFLEKPFTPTALAERVRQLLDAPG